MSHPADSTKATMAKWVNVTTTIDTFVYERYLRPSCPDLIEQHSLYGLVDLGVRSCKGDSVGRPYTFGK
jgi:hypothetical protein